MVNKLTFGLYFVLLLMALGATGFFFILVMLELLSWLFASLLPSSVALKYLLVQSYFVFWLIIMIIVFPEGLSVIFFMKLGLPPMHLWFFFVSLSLSNVLFLFFSTFHKLVPTIFLVNVLTSPMLLVVIFGFSSFLLLQLVVFYYVLLCSSMVHSAWLVFTLMISVNLFVFYFMIYVVILLGMLVSMISQEVISLSSTQSSHSNFLWLVFSGIPPMVFFWLKSIVVCFFMKVFFFSYAVIMTFFTVLALLGYFRVFHLSLKVSGMLHFFITPLLSSWVIFAIFSQ